MKCHEGLLSPRHVYDGIAPRDIFFPLNGIQQVGMSE